MRKKTAPRKKITDSDVAGNETSAAPQAAHGTFTIRNQLGLHARAAALFVKVANRFQSTIQVRRDTTTVNGKSIMGVLMLAAANGTRVEISAHGPDARAAVEELGKLIGDRFGEA
ncbi:MAG: HPr family phosphocarrier protein [Deltaproteobacteria bacterium]|nr:HPr family phosphocarrier protein [Deltaproteobacteria bacterium]